MVKDGRTTTLRGCSAVTDEARYKCEEHMTSTTVCDADDHDGEEEEEDDGEDEEERDDNNVVTQCCHIQSEIHGAHDIHYGLWDFHV